MLWLFGYGFDIHQSPFEKFHDLSNDRFGERGVVG
jgi:hypothetical protein